MKHIPRSYILLYTGTEISGTTTWWQKIKILTAIIQCWSVVVSWNIYSGQENLPRAVWNGAEWGSLHAQSPAGWWPGCAVQLCQLCQLHPVKSLFPHGQGWCGNKSWGGIPRVGSAQNKSWQSLTQQKSCTVPLKSHLSTGGITDGTLLFTCTCFKAK